MNSRKLVNNKQQTTKLFPRWDGPYHIIATHLEASTYTLDIHTNAFPVYHASEFKPHHTNDPILFPSHNLLTLVQ
jgi:hypothetical protein